MSNIDRGQFIKEVTADFADAAETTITLPRPVTTNPPLNNNKDHVIAPPARDEFRAGKAIVEFAATLDIAGVLIRKVELVRGVEGFAPNSPTFGGDNQGTNVIGVEEVGPTPGALFPNGSLGIGEPEVLYEAADNPLVVTSGLAMGTAADAIHKLLGNIPLDAHQSVRLTVFNNSGGALNGQKIVTTYDTGLFAGQYSLQS